MIIFMDIIWVNSFTNQVLETFFGSYIFKSGWAAQAAFWSNYEIPAEVSVSQLLVSLTAIFYVKK